MDPVVIASTASLLPQDEIGNQAIVNRLIDRSRVSGHQDQAAEEHALARAGAIEQKTGLKTRRFFRADTNPATIGLSILDRLMADADWSELDAIIVSSSSTQGFPGLSQQIVAAARDQHPELGHPFVLDVSSNACTGFMYGITIGQSLVKAMAFRKVALIAIEFSSRCINYDPKAFGISTLFGDAAAGLLLSNAKTGVASLLSCRASSLVSSETIAHIHGTGMLARDPQSEAPDHARWFVEGPSVALHAIRILTSEIKYYLDQGYAIEWLIPHQANYKRILIPACEATGIPISKLCTSFAETGNTSSASVPLLLDQLVQNKQAKPGDQALMIGFGASYSTGSALIAFH